MSGHTRWCPLCHFPVTGKDVNECQDKFKWHVRRRHPGYAGLGQTKKLWERANRSETV